MMTPEVKQIVGAEMNKFKQATERLRKFFIEERLMGQYNDRSVALLQELEEISRERDALVQSHSELKDIVKAKAAVLRRQSEECLGRGNRDGSEKKEQEAQAAENQVQGILEKINALDARSSSITNQCEDIARRIFVEEVFPALREALPILSRVWSTFLSGLRQGLLDYQDWTGVGTSGEFLWDDSVIGRREMETLGL